MIIKQSTSFLIFGILLLLVFVSIVILAGGPSNQSEISFTISDSFAGFGLGFIFLSIKSKKDGF